MVAPKMGCSASDCMKSYLYICIFYILYACRSLYLELVKRPTHLQFHLAAQLHRLVQTHQCPKLRIKVIHVKIACLELDL